MCDHLAVPHVELRVECLGGRWTSCCCGCSPTAALWGCLCGDSWVGGGMATSHSNLAKPLCHAPCLQAVSSFCAPSRRRPRRTSRPSAPAACLAGTCSESREGAGAKGNMSSSSEPLVLSAAVYVAWLEVGLWGQPALKPVLFCSPLPTPHTSPTLVAAQRTSCASRAARWLRAAASLRASAPAAAATCPRRPRSRAPGTAKCEGVGVCEKCGRVRCIDSPFIRP